MGLALHAGALLFLHRHVFAATRDAYDLFWHLASGRVIHETGAVPRADPFCFTSQGLDWVQMDWLSDLLLYRSYLLLGFAGPPALACVAVVLTLVTLLQSARARGAHALPTLLAIAPAALLLSQNGDVRPRLFSYLLLALTLLVLDRPDPQRRLAWPWAAFLGALMAIWLQLHGEALLGLGVLLLEAATSAFGAWREGSGWRCRRSGLLLLAAGGGVLVGGLLHPHGFAAMGEAVRNTLLTSGAPIYRAFGDAQPLDPSGSAGRLVEVGGAVLVVALVAGGPRPGLRDALLSLGLLHVTLNAQRAVIPLSVVVAPWAALTLTGALERGPPLVAGPHLALERRLGPAVRWLRLSLLGGLLLWLVLGVPARATPGRPGLLPSQGWRGVPLKATAWLLASGRQGKLFNEYSTGGLLAWALYPQRRTFVDGRANLHHKGPALEQYFTVTWLQPGWRPLLEASGVELVLSSRAQPLPNALRELGWPAVYEDEEWVILERPRR